MAPERSARGRESQRPSFLMLHLIKKLQWLGLALMLGGGGVTRAADPVAPAHDLYMGVSMTKGFVIGGKIQRISGLYRSRDRETVEHVGFNHPRQDTLASDPRDRDRLYTVGLNGVLSTRDGGQSWRILTGWDMTEPKDIALDPNAPDHLYIGLPDGVGVSRDRGRTWRRLNEGIRRSYTQTIVVDRTKAGRVLAGTELGIYLSEDAAASWRRVLETRATVNDIVQSPHDPRHFAAVTQRDGAWESRDGGVTWRRMTGVGDARTLHNVAFDANDRRRLAISSWHTGVLVSEDGGRTWEARNTGLPVTDVWRVAIDPDLPGRLYAGPHESAVHVSDDYGRTWRSHWFEGAIVWDFVFVPRAEADQAKR